MKIPFGLRRVDDRMVSPLEVENGKKCGCICPGCGRDLVAKQGDIHAWHFAHDSGADCSNGVESSIHRMAKQLIVERKQLWVPNRIFKREVHGPFDEFTNRTIWKEQISIEVQPEGLKSLTDCLEEKQIDTRRPDILANLDGRPIAIEVAYTHFCDDEKLAWLKGRNLTTIEIDLEMPPDINQKDILGELENRLFASTSYTKWLVHASDAEANHWLDVEEKRIRESKEVADAEFEKILDKKRVERKRKDEFIDSVKEIEYENFKVDRDLTIHVARSRKRCTLKWFGKLTSVPDYLKQATRDAAIKYGGKFNKGYYVWEYYVSESRVEETYKKIVAFMEQSLETYRAITLNSDTKSVVISHDFSSTLLKRVPSPFDNLLESAEVEFFDERAGIIEFDGLHDRQEAEKLAYELVLINR